MSHSYEEYEQEYDRNLSRVRAFLSSDAKSVSILKECDRLLSEARRCATAMQELAGVEGFDALKFNESQRRVQRDVLPLLKEVDRAMRVKQEKMGSLSSFSEQRQKRELFQGYRPPSSFTSVTAPDDVVAGDEEEGESSFFLQNDTDRLIRNSEQLLKESQSLCAESEQLGSATLVVMGGQREQLEFAADSLYATKGNVRQAGIILKQMSKTVFRNKLFLRAVIVFLVVANVFVIFLIFRKKK